MTLRKLMYSMTFRKRKVIVEQITVIALITMMLSVLTNMAVSLNKAYSALTLTGMNWDMSLINCEKEVAEDFYYSSLKNDNIVFASLDSGQVYMNVDGNDAFDLGVVGIKGDYFKIEDDYVFEDGREPENKYEIALSSIYAQQLFGEVGIGDDIEVNYQKDGETLYCTFTVVGFFTESTYSIDTFKVLSFVSVETIEDLMGESGLYGVTICTDSNNIAKMYSNLNTINLTKYYEMGQINDDNIVFNDEKSVLMTEKLQISGLGSMGFIGVAMLIALSGAFMIYNVISSTRDELIKCYSFLRCQGMTLKRLLINFVNIMFGISLIGILLGTLMGNLLNLTIGRFLIYNFVQGINSVYVKNMVFQNNVKAYFLAMLIVVFAVFSVSICIWRKIQKTGIMESKDSGITYGTKMKSISRRNRRLINSLGKVNIHRNRTLMRCIFINYFIVLLVITIIVLYSVNMSYSDKNTRKKASFCDYEIILDNKDKSKSLSMEQFIYIKSNLDGELYGAYDMATEYNSVSSKDYEALIKGLNVDSKYENEQDVILNNIDTIEMQVGSSIYIVDEAILTNLITGNGLSKSGLTEPMIFVDKINNRKEIIIFDRYDNAITLPLAGELHNYLPSIHYGVKDQIVMDYTAAEYYLDFERSYTDLYVKSDMTEPEMYMLVANLSEELGIKLYCSTTHPDSGNVDNETVFLISLVVYIILCLSIICIIDTLCIMKVTVKQRSKEYEILKALGMTKKDIISLISFESKSILQKSICFSLPLAMGIAVILLYINEESIGMFKTMLSLIASITVVYFLFISLCRIAGAKLVKETVFEENSLSV